VVALPVGQHACQATGALPGHPPVHRAPLPPTTAATSGTDRPSRSRHRPCSRMRWAARVAPESTSRPSPEWSNSLQSHALGRPRGAPIPRLQRRCRIVRRPRPLAPWPRHPAALRAVAARSLAEPKAVGIATYAPLLLGTLRGADTLISGYRPWSHRSAHVSPFPA
jgi:hypothetical protein